MAYTEVLVMVCPQCKSPAQGFVEGTVVWNGYGASREVEGPPTEYRLIMCHNCNDASLMVRENYGEGFEVDQPAFVYPAPRRLSHEVPTDLRAEWEEARACFDAKAYKASAVMIRRTLEGVCPWPWQSPRWWPVDVTACGQ